MNRRSSCATPQFAVKRIARSGSESRPVSRSLRGYGTYAFHTRSRVDTIDPCAVAAMFTWDDDGDGNGDGVTVLTAREGADNSRLALVARGSAMDLPGPRAANRCSRQLSSL